jgi:transcription elongation factor Elf1
VEDKKCDIERRMKMVNNTVECPYCEHENDMSEGTVDKLGVGTDD